MLAWRNSIAKWIPLSSRPGIGRSRGRVAPVQSTIASNSSSSCAPAIVLADLGAGDEGDSFVGHQLHAALDDPFFELHVRDAVHQQPADPVGPFVRR